MSVPLRPLPDGTAAAGSSTPSQRMPRKIFIGGMVTPKTVDEMLVIERGIIGVGSGGTIRFVENLVHVEAEMKKEVRMAMAQHSGGAAINGYAAAHDELSEGSTTEEESETARIIRSSRKNGAPSQPVAIPRPAQESPPIVARHLSSPGESPDSSTSSSTPPEDADAQTDLTDPPAAASVAPPPTDEADVPPPAPAAVEEERVRSTSQARAASGISEAALLESALVKRVVEKHGWKVGDYETIRIEKGGFLLPGFVDTHTHACQVPNAGLGQQYELLDWLNNITFPREKKFEDLDYAHRTYSSVVQRLLDCGTTTACYYATLHLEATKILADVCHEKGQRAFIGKCQMDRNGGAGYEEKEAARSMDDTKEFIGHCRALATGGATSTVTGVHGKLEPLSPTGDEMDASVARLSATMREMEGKVLSKHSKSPSVGSNSSQESASPPSVLPGATIPKSFTRSRRREAGRVPMSPSHSRTRDREVANALVQPILTPRFAIACTDALLAAIAALQARDPMLRIQTHLSENPSEIAFTKSLFPFAESYASVYDHFGLLTQRTILAHAVHLESSEMDLISKRGCGISHCPTSNLNLRSGCSPLGELLNRGIKVGLGTDVSGGYALSMLTTIRDTSIVAKVLAMTKDRVSSEVAKEKAIEASLPKKASRDFTQGPLPIATLLFLATLGGAQVCALESKIGSLEPGKDFDALFIRTTATWSEQRGYTGNPGMYVEAEDGLPELLEKVLFTGDDRSIAQTYVRGRRVDSGAFFELS